MSMLGWLRRKPTSTELIDRYGETLFGLAWGVMEEVRPAMGGKDASQIELVVGLIVLQIQMLAARLDDSTAMEVGRHILTRLIDHYADQCDVSPSELAGEVDEMCAQYANLNEGRIFIEIVKNANPELTSAWAVVQLTTHAKGMQTALHNVLSGKYDADGNVV